MLPRENYDTLEYSKVKCYNGDSVRLRNPYSIERKKRQHKACPKDDFPLPRINKIVDDAANSQLMSLLDCFSGYHQIWMRKKDEEKLAL